ncbi:hypothetical protein [Planctomicrobium sp. SH664]|uniref:hypothetical protein n=1 Tax=Planctomicrobium sp. SH664 TaxID=3448125 RepID=UPI003F5C6464
MSFPELMLPKRSGPASCWRWGVAVSVGLHGLLIGGLIWLEIQAVTGSAQISLPQSTHIPQVELVAANMGLKPVEPAELITAEPVPIPGLPVAAANLGQFVQTKLQQVIEEQRKVPRSESEHQLDVLAERLQRQIGESTVDSIGSTLRNVMKLPERATEPTPEQPGGEFDPQTLQIYDVQRVTSDSGVEVYRGILIDAQGRRQEIEFSAAEGEELFRVFEMMRRYPLLEKLYRGVMMSVFDQLMQSRPVPARTRQGGQAQGLKPPEIAP